MLPCSRATLAGATVAEILQFRRPQARFKHLEALRQTVYHATHGDFSEDVEERRRFVRHVIREYGRLQHLDTHKSPLYFLERALEGFAETQERR